MQLDLFQLNEPLLEREGTQSTSKLPVATVDTETDAIVFKVLTTETDGTKGFLFEDTETPIVEEQTAASNEAYEVGDIVTVDFPTEDTDFELYNYLHFYFPHIKGKKGKIIKIMPYSKLQYLVEFDVKSEDRTLILYHRNLVWISN